MLIYFSLIKRIFFYFLLSAFLLLSAVVALSYIYQDKIISLFIEEANKHIKTPVNVGKINFSILEKFPHLSIGMDNIVIQEGIHGSTAPLAKAKRIYFTFSILDFIQGNYIVNQVYLENGEVYPKILKSGKNNYTIFEKDSTSDGGSVSFKLEKIILNKVLLNYSDEKRDQDFTLFAENVSANLFTENRIFDVGLQGEVTSHSIQVQGEEYFRNKDLRLDAKFLYDQNSDSIAIYPSVVKVHESEFLVEGNYYNNGTSQIDLSVQGENTDIQTILSLVPEKFYEKFKVYKSEGNVYFAGTLKGEISETEYPALNISFGCKEASFFHPRYKKEITKVNLEGTFTNNKANDLSSAILQLKNIKGSLDGRRFSGNLTLQNFSDYYLSCKIDGEFDVQSLLGFYPVEEIESASGLINLDVSFDGRLNNLKTTKTATKTKASGEIILDDLSFNLKKNNLPFTDFNGSFIFKNDDLAISDFSGEVGNSKFLLNGFFNNVLAYLIFDDQPISIEADLKSSLLDIDELLTGNVKEQSKTVEGEQYYSSFNISPKLVLSFNCDIDQIKFRRLKGRNLKGQLKVKNQIATGNKIHINAAGGSMTLDGTVDAGSKNQIEVKTQAAFEGIDIDSLFYIFQNFNQDFLVEKHLKGQIYAEVNSYMMFDDNLRLNTQSFRSEVGISIKNGELNNFEPMQKLSKYVEEESLARLRFSEIKNLILIDNKTIFLPDMEIQSNVSSIRVNGTHTFDQHIDYHLQVPLRDFRKRDRDETFAVVEEDGSTSNLFLTIKGTTDDYKIAYDTEAVKQKIKQDIKKEGQELKKVFKNKGQTDKKAKELNEEEYFDFGDGQ